jgi:hypothetical protein
MSEHAEYELPRIYDEPSGLSTYGWVPEMQKDGIAIRVSKSTMNNTKWCLQQHWLSQIIPVPDEAHDYLIIGDDVHHTIEEFYRRIEREMETNDNFIEWIQKLAKEDRVRGALLQLQEFLPDRDDVIKMRRPSLRDEPFYTATYNHNVEWLMRHEVMRLANIDDLDTFLPVGNEVKLITRVDDYTIGEHTIPVTFVGIIDRVFQNEDGGLVLMELKTGKWKPNKVSDMRREMAYYQWLIEMSPEEELRKLGLDQQVTHWAWRFSGADHWDYEPVKAVSKRAMQKVVGDLVQAYLKQDFPVTTADFKCSYCKFQPYCPKFTEVAA